MGLNGERGKGAGPGGVNRCRECEVTRTWKLLKGGMEASLPCILLPERKDSVNPC